MYPRMGADPDVFIRAMTGRPRRLVVSSNGGSRPVWRRDGREILYVDREGRLQARAVDDRPDGGLRLGATVALNVPRIGPGHWGTQYDVSRDGTWCTSSTARCRLVRTASKS